MLAQAVFSPASDRGKVYLTCARISFVLLWYRVEKEPRLPCAGVPLVSNAILVIAVLLLIASLAQLDSVYEEVRTIRPDDYLRGLFSRAADTFIWNSPLSEAGRRRYMRSAILLCASLGLLALGHLVQGSRDGALGFGFVLTTCAEHHDIATRHVSGPICKKRPLPVALRALKLVIMPRDGSITFGKQNLVRYDVDFHHDAGLRQILDEAMYSFSR